MKLTVANRAIVAIMVNSVLMGLAHWLVPQSNCLVQPDSGR
ncbi:MAG: hypothetical protein ACERLB_02105 [Gammaproteobacteria bacterium]